MSEKSYVHGSIKYYDLSNYAILALFIPSCMRQIFCFIDTLYITHSHFIFHTKDINQIIKFT